MSLEIQQISKHYKNGTRALQNISLTLAPGILGLLGPNGAGKSSLMRILATLSSASEGRVLWRSQDIRHQPDALRAELGYLPQDFGVYPNLSAREFLDYLSAVKGIPAKLARQRIAALLTQLNLEAVADKPLHSYSGGMRQRVGIAQALLNDPALLMVDEPTVDLDPEERVRFRDLLAELAGERFIILSTHIVSDIEATASRIAVMNHGRLLVHAEPEALLGAVEGRVWEWVVSSAEFLAVRARHRLAGCQRRSDGVHLRILAEQAPDISAWQVPATLEDAYLYLIDGGELTAEAPELSGVGLLSAKACVA